MDANHAPYERLKDNPRGTSIAAYNKAWALDNIHHALHVMRRLNKKLSWNELIEPIKSANDLDAWSLRDMSTGYIPYILLTCTDKFAKGKGAFDRDKEVLFALESSPDGAVTWNSSNLKKEYIGEIEVSNRKITKHFKGLRFAKKIV